MRGNSWNADGVVHTVIDDDAPTPALQLLEPLMAQFQPSDNEDVQLEIEFNSQGHNDPGSKYGDSPCPPDSSDERTLIGMTLYGPGVEQGVPVPPRIAQQLFQIYYSQIEEADLDETGGPEDEAYDRARDARYESKMIRDVSRLITEDPDVFDK